MTTLIILFILSLLLVWMLVMYGVWKEKEQLTRDPLLEVTAVYSKSSRLLRRGWFAALRYIAVARDMGTVIATKVFFAIFPKARKAFESKDALTGLEHGPSSYFLKSITPEKREKPEEKRIRRKRKNV